MVKIITLEEYNIFKKQKNRNKYFLSLIVLLLFFPLVVSATSFKVEDMNINIDENEWIVFTQKNILDEDKIQALKEMGIDAYDIFEKMVDGNIYIEAITKSSNNNALASIEIEKKEGYQRIKNLHTYSDTEIKNELKSDTSIKQELGEGSYQIKSMKGYKYFYGETYDHTLNIHTIGYVTFINGSRYAIKVSQKEDLSIENKEKFEKCLKSINFSLKSDYEIRSKQSNSLWEKALSTAIATIIISGVASLIGLSNNQNSKSKRGDKSQNSKNDKVEVFEFKQHSNETKKETFDEAKNEKYQHNTKENKIEKFVCSNCGHLIDSYATKCQHCGEIFEEDESIKENGNKTKRTISDVDQKYSDLTKLKELYDNKIITKEEFKEQKKKILDKE